MSELIRARLKEMRVGMRMKAFLLVFLAALFGCEYL
jgi:hypothetical protein